MERHASVKWSRAVRTIIEGTLDDFEEAERLAKKSVLTGADIEFLSAKVENEMGRHARKLLNESNR